MEKNLLLPALPGEMLAHLETPCIVIDMDQTRKNIRKMQDMADGAGCALRPHIKTHKMGLFARMQIEAGAKGITCAKISEAEVMAAAGIDDIFVAYPLAGEFRFRRAAELGKKLRRLILGVDSIPGARALNAAAAEAGVRFEVRMEIDTGARRTGISQERMIDLARYITEQPCLDLTGIYTFKSLVYRGAATTDAALAAQEEGEYMAAVAERLAEAGIPVTDISAGSTPTAAGVAGTELVTEIRPGTYIFNDYMLYREGAASTGEISAFFYATVVSTPEKGYAVIDGGTKTFPMDIMLNTPPYHYPSYAVVDGREDLVLTRMNEEHGMLTALKGDTGLEPGQILRLIPIHICTAINMQNRVYLYDNGILTVQNVDARGMLA
ncbi:MAG: alanine racemase [Spirochaetaceae bacterium]|jgi:D-serine deaminase-like pyridoxal phosphate-dependent protein|nr:alanine racemase [Spirochaetaceae bacterium]